MRDTGAVSPRRPHQLTSAGVVTVSVLAVVAVLVLPAWLSGSTSSGPSEPRRPTPTRQADESAGTRSWTPQNCSEDCSAPPVLNLGGARFLHQRGHRRQVNQSSDSNALSQSVRAAGGRRWILVGAVAAGPGSQLSVKLDDAGSLSVASGKLSLIALPIRRGSVEVTLADYGRPGPQEVLRIEEYDAQR